MSIHGHAASTRKEKVRFLLLHSELWTNKIVDVKLLTELGTLAKRAGLYRTSMTDIRSSLNALLNRLKAGKFDKATARLTPSINVRDES